MNFGWEAGSVIGECLKYGEPLSWNGCVTAQPQGVMSDFWIARWMSNHRGEVIAAANRHNLLPEFLGAVLYLEQSSYGADAELNASSILPGAAIRAQGNLLWNLNPASDSGSNFTADKIPLLAGKRLYGRDEGIGNIKPDVAARVEELGLLYDPFTGEKTSFPSSRQVLFGISITEMWGLNYIGIRANPTARFATLGRLANPSWSVEYLAAHLDSARLSLEWPGDTSKSDAGSELAMEAMFIYHYNIDNFNGYNGGIESEPFRHWIQVMNFIPQVQNLLFSSGFR